MSVPLSLRGEGQLVVITKTNALAEHTIMETYYRNLWEVT